MKKIFLLFVMMTGILSATQAKIWRINNNAGITADFSSFHAAANSSAVLGGDTLYMEPSNTQYATNSMTLTKRLVVVGPGFFLDPANSTTPGNPGLQVSTTDSEIAFLRLGTGSDGSRFLGVTMSGALYFNGAANVSFEKVYFPSGIYYETGTNDATSIRKCFFNNGINISNSGTAVISNFICENNIFYGGAYITLTALAGSGNIVRNNSVVGGNAFTLNNTYVANNIFAIGSQSNFTNCTIKNNLFQIAQTLPGTAVGNQLSVNMTNVYVGGTTGSLDSRAALKAGSPAIAAGLTVGAVVTPDCGAYGATDPYKLSGIPNIPSIYALTVPVSIPSGSATMNVTFSTRNNN
jgi:hypothetical protein